MRKFQKSSPRAPATATTTKKTCCRLFEGTEEKVQRRRRLTVEGRRTTLEHGESMDGTVMISPRNATRVTELGTHKVVVMKSKKGVSSGCFSPSGDTILVSNSVDSDRIATLWSLADHAAPSQAAAAGAAAAAVVVGGDEPSRPPSREAATSGPLMTFADVHTDMIAFSTISHDGSRIATCGRDNIAVIWETQTGRPLLKVEGHTNGVRHCAFSQDGTRLVTASFDTTVAIWSTAVLVPDAAATDGAATDTAEAAPPPTIPLARKLMTLKGHASDVYCAEFSCDGTMVVSASADCTAIVWDVRDEATLLAENVEALSRLPTKADDVSVREASSGSEILLPDRLVTTLIGHLSIVRSAKFDQSGERIITASTDGSAAVWCLATSQRIAVMIPPGVGHKPGLHAAEFSPAGDDHCLTASEDGAVRIWCLPEGTSAAWCVATLKGAKAGSAAICSHAHFAPDGRSIVGSFADGNIYHWKAAVREQRRTMLTGHDDRIWSAKFSPDGKTIYSSSSDQSVGVWDVRSGECLHKLTGVHTNSIRGISVSRCGRYICTGCPDKKVGVWDSQDEYRLCAEFVHTDNIYAVAAAKDKADKPMILFASSDNCASIVDVFAGAPDADGVQRSGVIKATFKGHTDCCAAVDWSEDCTRIVTGGDDKQAFVFDVASESIVTPLVGHSSYVLCCAFGPGTARDARGKNVPSRCLTGSNDRSAILWDAITGAQLRVFIGHAHAVWGVAFAPDGGSTIATSSQDATVALWRVDSDDKMLALSGHTGTIFDVDFASDGETLISAGRDAAIGVWHLSAPAHTSDIIEALNDSDDVKGTTTKWLLDTASLNNTWSMNPFDGGNAVHSLAACYSSTWPDKSRYGEVLEAWFEAGDKAPYYPIEDDNGATPLELAINRANRHFIAGLFKSKGLLGSSIEGGDGIVSQRNLRANKTGVEGERFACSFLTDRDLKALVTFWPQLAVRFFVEGNLLAAAPKHIAEGCHAFAFPRAFEVVGSDHGPSEEAGLWHRYAQRCPIRLRQGCTPRRTAEQVEALIVALPGLSGAPYSCGHDALRGFVNGGNDMLDAFDTDAMHVLTEFRWRTFGKLGYIIRFGLFTIFLAVHSWFVTQVKYYRSDALLNSDGNWDVDDTGALNVTRSLSWAMVLSGVFLVVGSIGWLLSEVAQIANLRSNWLEYFRDLYNWNDVISSLITIIMVLCLFLGESGSFPMLRDSAASVGTVASMLAWLRLFEIVRGVPGFGFYPFLVVEAINDMRPFLFVLFVTATAFSVSMMPLAKEHIVVMGVTKSNPFYTIDTAIYRTMLMTVGDWDSTEIIASQNPFASQGLFMVFLVFVPIVMLSMLISILGDTFDRVTEQQSRVVSKQRMQVTMHVEAEVYAMTCCCRKRFDAWIRPRWYPRWLHVLRPRNVETSGAGGEWKGRMHKLYNKIELHGLQTTEGVESLGKRMEQQLAQANEMSQQRHDELARELGIRIKAIDDLLRQSSHAATPPPTPA